MDTMKRLALWMALAPMLALTPLPVLAQVGPGPGAGPGGGGPPAEKAQRLQRRHQLALTLGLAEALDLTDAQAFKVRDQIEKLAPRRWAAQQQMQEAVQVLRRAAQAGKVAAGEVDQAVNTLLDARAQVQVVDRELITTLTKDQPPEKRARAVLLLARFHQRVDQAVSKLLDPRAQVQGRRDGDGRRPRGGRGLGPCGGGAGPGPRGAPEAGPWEDDGDQP